MISWKTISGRSKKERQKRRKSVRFTKTTKKHLGRKEFTFFDPRAFGEDIFCAGNRLEDV